MHHLGVIYSGVKTLFWIMRQQYKIWDYTDKSPNFTPREFISPSEEKKIRRW